ncbi:ABC transporter permease [Rhizobium calliandrae]|uniref:ABC transporter permease n=1 Tax=Rhizobium calliandrae TaxID=1312182 RepID=A0ABT7KKL7_9HYPH|nr:ABC transporter permease [Rhizobium calliandrae]MDL2409182.1 ABC transporter permease [Rhizobium calliandrae]
MIGLWLKALLRRRFARITGTAMGVAITVALITLLFLFLTDSSASMTRRSVSAVPIDWQVEVSPGADLAMISDAIGKAAPIAAERQVSYAAIGGLEASAHGTVQTTGPGKAIAFDKDYLKDFPKEMRLLSGRADGIVVAQQTAANLAIVPGDTISIGRIGLSPQTVKVDGVVDLPDADTLFQAVGLPPQAAPQAPPDNVVILPLETWQALFGPQQAGRPDTTRTQFHVRLDHSALPASPVDAWAQVNGAGKNLEARIAGQALLANNLAARLDAVRGDSLYATVLFVFLGLPGVALACLLTIAIASAGGGQRRMEQALLRMRGADMRRVLALSAAEAIVVAMVGTAAGLIVAMLFASWEFGTETRLSTTLLALSLLIGLTLSLAAFLVAAWRNARYRSVHVARRAIRRLETSSWQWLWLDLILLTTSLLFFLQSASTGYQIVLAPEGVAATSVDYYAFVAPALFWIGSALLMLRLSGLVIADNGKMLKWLVGPVAGRLTPIVSAALSHQSGRIAVGIAMTALAISFATSTAIFNTTYNAQALVDAELTNGADVTVFGTTANPAGAKRDALAALPGVKGIQPMQHRFAYVGNDLQDLYGIDPTAIGKATTLSDAYFSGGTAAKLLADLTTTPNGVLVSEETVQDFQLKIGDTINLRLVSGADNQYHAVPFVFLGVAREFPTAPRDSFLVANAAYVARMTGTKTNEYLLLKAAADPAALARTVRRILSGDPSLQIKDIGSAANIIGSSLTAVDLSGLTAIELTFAFGLAISAAGLMLWLGFADRRRDFAILMAIGAKPAQMAAFLWGEGILIATGGLVYGLSSGVLLAWMLVKLLTGVFDPPPDALSIPFVYLALVIVLLLASLATAIFSMKIDNWGETADYMRDI